MSLPFKVEENHRNVHSIYLDRKGGNEYWFLLASDHHWDNPKSNQKLIKKHLDEAKEKNAGVLIFGDFFCAMQGKYDKRSSKHDIRPEHLDGNYLDLLVETGADFLGQYAENLIVIGQGNHETAILKNHETNLLDRLVSGINMKFRPKKPVYLGGYSGWVRFMFAGKTGMRKSFRLFYNHGYGGGGPVTKDIIQASRRAVYLPDADFVVSGHTHDEWQFTIQRARLSDQGTPHTDEQIHLKLPTYKDEFIDGYGGWAIEKGHPPKPQGAWWLRFKVGGGGNQIEYDFIRAK